MFFRITLQEDHYITFSQLFIGLLPLRWLWNKVQEFLGPPDLPPGVVDIVHLANQAGGGGDTGITTQSTAIVSSQDEARGGYQINMVQVIYPGAKTDWKIIQFRANPGETGFKGHDVQAETFVDLVEKIFNFTDRTLNHSMSVVRCNCTC